MVRGGEMFHHTLGIDAVVQPAAFRGRCGPQSQLARQSGDPRRLALRCTPRDSASLRMGLTATATSRARHRRPRPPSPRLETKTARWTGALCGLTTLTAGERSPGRSSRSTQHGPGSPRLAITPRCSASGRPGPGQEGSPGRAILFRLSRAGRGAPHLERFARAEGKPRPAAREGRTAGLNRRGRAAPRAYAQGLYKLSSGRATQSVTRPPHKLELRGEPAASFEGLVNAPRQQVGHRHRLVGHLSV